MAPEDLVWHGPRTLTAVRQVCIPIELLRALDLAAGDRVQFALTEAGDQIVIRPVAQRDTAPREARHD